MAAGCRDFHFDSKTNTSNGCNVNVRGWPTLYVVDHEGIIRHKWLGSPGDQVLDKAIESLVEQVHDGKK